MCGIFGVIGGKKPVNEIIDGLSALEYRGYDSSGIAYLQNDKIKTIKSVGNIAKLKQKVSKIFDGKIDGEIAIGHTRWATNGGVSEENSHPHLSADGKVAVVHNGIIENYTECVSYLRRHGIKLQTTVDTEVIPNILLLLYHNNNDIQYAIRQTMKMLSGDYAICVIFADKKDTLLIAKHGNMPLHLGFGDETDNSIHTVRRGETNNSKTIFVSSDILAFPKSCKFWTTLESDEFAIVSKKQVQYFDQIGEITKPATAATITTDEISKNGFTTYMEKEINEIPQVIERIIGHYTNNNEVKQKIAIIKSGIKRCSCLHIVACGTSYHAGLIIGSQIEKHLKVRTKTTIASEFTADTIIGRNEFAIVISQSGETADTISAMRILQKHGVPIMALCNVTTSTIARGSSVCFPMLCGAEIAVASTKAFVSSVLIGAILVNQIAGKADSDFIKLPEIARSLIHSTAEDILSHSPTNFNKIFFIGKGTDYFLALESALKVKEITYTHCEGLPAGELKHGTLSLVDDKTLAIAYFSNDEHTNAKINNAVMEISARGGNVVRLFETNGARFGVHVPQNEKTTYTNTVQNGTKHTDTTRFGVPVPQSENTAYTNTVHNGTKHTSTTRFGVSVPQSENTTYTNEMRAGKTTENGASQCPADFVIKIIPAQKFALQLSQRLGINPDQPRNLAKSVTVE
ncbi:MAG: glutamine--fructose-6-phosphate transaminase (isomerizing) [Christensenellaceae bacterium]|jgi:glucosamine--fructose-6-phosphate aminotransferase (isomerizing)|nr:glutamine--fructose-6-phosphate transaminase (isomerizing) [Christensenellaceae bacterium]